MKARQPTSVQAVIKAQAKHVVEGVLAGDITGLAAETSDLMDEMPGAVLDVVTLIQREASRKKPNHDLIRAYAMMFANGLTLLRYRIERGEDWAEGLVDAVRDRLYLLAEGGLVSSDLLCALLNGFIEARLDPGEDLTSLFGELAAASGAANADVSWQDIGSALESLADEANGDPFFVHAALAEISQALPAQAREAILEELAAAGNPVLGETATLYLLDPAPEVRGAVCRIASETRSPALASPVALRRMIAVRNWLPGGERRRVDAAIRTTQERGVDCASLPQPDVRKIVASTMDGAGAQSIFAVVKSGRKHTVGCLMVKETVGVADAWCLTHQSKADVDGLLGKVEMEVDSLPVGIDFLRTLIAHHLAVGVRLGSVPPPGFLQFFETVGSEPCQPSERTADDLIATLEGEAGGPSLGPDAINGIVAASGHWVDSFDFMTSWFEDDAEVRGVLSRRPRSRPKTKADAVVAGILEPRRDKWASRFLWTALWMKERRDLLTPWIDLFVVGRELHRGRPVADIPVMRSIAGVTVAAISGSR